QLIFERYRRIPGAIRVAILEPILQFWPKALDVWLTRKARGYIEKANVPLPARLESWNIAYRLGVDAMLHPERAAAIDIDRPFETMQEVWDSTPSDNVLQRLLYYDWQYTLADNDLRKVETTCAAAGIQVSYPMLHPAVVDFATQIPPALMMPNGRLRDFYKRAMRGFLPDAIVDKKKHGFGLPFGLWLRDSERLRDLVFSNLQSLRRRRWIRDSFIDRLLSLHANEDARYFGVMIWVLAMLEQWFQEHDVSV
ncbi:MAG: asparagine synthase C-terminal domain-containing protein, partial [Steroidobacteraceae bacterium]|nr:asparagine synthase C-terminal domain-containing protein [Steroidobacteraceae bacterium]MDW8260198.1 asparagine synthase-related protein [Gammaproteobacteria bacterium]